MQQLDATTTPPTSGLALSPIIYDAYHLPGAVQVGDLNHDGREDVVLANDAWRTLSVYTQNSAATLDAYATAQIPYSSRYRPNALALGDFDGNGGMDVAAVGRDPGLSVLSNTAGAPTAVISSPAPYATVLSGERDVTGTTSVGTTRVEVRVKGLSDWVPATLIGTDWSATVNLPASSAGRAWWIEARATDAAGRVQAPPARVRVRASGRVRDGLLVEYLFDETEGTTVYDTSGVGTPLDLTLANEAAVSRVPAGLFVHTPTRIASPEPTSKVTDALKTSNAFTMEAWVRTANITQDGPARIMTLSDDSQHLNVSLGQSRFDRNGARISLRLHTSTPSTGKRVGEAFAELPLTTDLTHLLVTRDAGGTLIFYLNGVEQGRSQLAGDFSSWSDRYKLLFGNDALAERPWLGEYHLAAIYQRALTPDEVTQNYAAGPVGDGSPAQITDTQVVYTFNDGSGTTVGDSSLVLPALPAQIADATLVSWGDGSLTINNPTIIATEGAATKVNRASMATGEITVEAWVAPANTTQSGPARIVTISKDISQRNVTLGQGLWGNQQSDLYLARLRSTTTSWNGEPHLNAPTGSLTPALTYVVYTRDVAGKARLFINGVEQASATVSGDLTNWDASYRLALANEFTMNRTWLGSYHFMAISSRAFTSNAIAARYLAGPEHNGEHPVTTVVGPFVQRVSINGGELVTSERQITVEVETQMPAGRTVDQVTVAEYGFDPGRKTWALLQRAVLSGGTTYLWELKPGSGVRYLQVWATDSAGVITSYPYQTMINLAPSDVELAQRSVHVYRAPLSAGQTLTVNVTASRGDADLYVWGPTNASSMRWVSNASGSTDQVSFVAPVSGIYQIEVHGYTNTTYRLGLDGRLAEASLAAPEADQAENKVLPSTPEISVDSTPAYTALSNLRVYLPHVAR